ncbi:helix-turn-helix transcriptional regulator [Streptomyces sp. NPDC046976]|uniref:response regulator transcription factor n=1 Tax=Streptomyces sp. NPDC046976 TaxID=3155258 RepID=UPI0033CBB70D
MAWERAGRRRGAGRRGPGPGAAAGARGRGAARALSAGDRAPAGLSPREEQVLRFIASGMTHGQVARRIGISRHTVDTYVKRVRSEFGIGNKAELTRVAFGLQPL